MFARALRARAARCLAMSLIIAVSMLGSSPAFDTYCLILLKLWLACVQVLRTRPQTHLLSSRVSLLS